MQVAGHFRLNSCAWLGQKPRLSLRLHSMSAVAFEETGQSITYRANQRPRTREHLEISLVNQMLRSTGRSLEFLSGTGTTLPHTFVGQSTAIATLVLALKFSQR